MKYLPLLVGVGLIAFCVISIVQLHAVEPVAVSIEDVVEGNFPEDTYVRVTGGIAVYRYAYLQKQGEKDKVEVICYPLYAKNDEVLDKIATALSTYPSAEAIPVNWYKQNLHCQVLVKTKKYGRLSEIPTEADQVAVVGSIRKGATNLHSELKKPLKGDFHNVDLEKTILIEEGRRPDLPIRIWGIIAGVALIFVSIIWVAVARSKARQFHPAQTQGEGKSYGGYAEQRNIQPPYSDPQSPLSQGPAPPKDDPPPPYQGENQ